MSPLCLTVIQFLLTNTFDVGNEKLRLVTFLQKCDEKCSLKVAKVSTTIGRVAKNGFGNILSRTKSDICTLGNTAFE